MGAGCAIMVRMSKDYSHDWSKTRMAEPENPLALAGASDPNPIIQAPQEPREVFPVAFDKDYMDFRPAEVAEDELVPKGSSALERVSELTFEESLIPAPEPESESLGTLDQEIASQMSAPPSVVTGT